MKPFPMEKAQENKLSDENGLSEKSEEDRLIANINIYINAEAQNKKAKYNTTCAYNIDFKLANKIKNIYELEGYHISYVIEENYLIQFSISW